MLTQLAKLLKNQCGGVLPGKFGMGVSCSHALSFSLFILFTPIKVKKIIIIYCAARLKCLPKYGHFNELAPYGAVFLKVYI